MVRQVVESKAMEEGVEENRTALKTIFLPNEKPLPLHSKAAGVSLSTLYIPEIRTVLNGSRFRMPAFPDAVQTGRMQPT